MMTESKEPESKIEQAIRLEREAHHFKEEGKTDRAFYAFDWAATHYRLEGEHLKAAICYASAASCWNIHTGRQPLRNAATRNETGAHEAVKAGHFSYARSLFREAALLYESEGNYESQSVCFIAAQDSHAAHQWSIFWRGRETRESSQVEVRLPWWRRLEAIFKCSLLTMSRLIWGHGERPVRTFLTGCILIFGCAFVYAFSGLVLNGEHIRGLNFIESLYFSVVTYTTLGYGDFVPLGWVRWVSMFEALSGIFLSPIFIIALTRKYLRIYH